MTKSQPIIAVLCLILLQGCGNRTKSSTQHNNASNRDKIIGTTSNVPDQAYIKKQINDLINEIKIKPKDAKLHSQISVYYSTIGDIKSALKEMKIAVQLEPKNAFIHEQYSCLLEGQAQIDEIKNAIKLDPKNSFNYASLAIIMASNRNEKEAIRLYKRAVSLRSINSGNGRYIPIYSYELAGLYNKTGNLESAEESYEDTLAYLKAYKSDWSMDSPQVTKHYPAIESDCKKNLTMIKSKLKNDRPSYKWLKAQFSYFNFDSGNMSENDANETIKDVSNKLSEGNTGDYYFSKLGDAYMSIANYDEAVICYLACKEFNDNETVKDSLGMAYFAQGRLKLASDYLMKGSFHQLANKIKKLEIKLVKGKSINK